jgi:hypothetical protein
MAANLGQASSSVVSNCLKTKDRACIDEADFFEQQPLTVGGWMIYDSEMDVGRDLIADGQLRTRHTEAGTLPSAQPHCPSK